MFKVAREQRHLIHSGVFVVDFKLFSSVPIVDFEQVNVSGVFHFVSKIAL